ncbi:MAG: sugar ABC transporter permease [Propionibacteriaceae bacterium]|jgi:putative multiple sugar transport system permease protein|nr:sugar ABC transporter permease [Propionibacteriaceae bacterium]
MNQLKDLVGKNLRQYGIMLALVVIVITFAAITGGKLVQPNNVAALIGQNAYVLILALGMLLVIIAGHIDLSVGSGVALIGAIIGYQMSVWQVPWGWAVLTGLGVGLLIGAWQGFWVAFVKIPAFVVTLAGMLLFRGLDQVIAARTMASLPQGFVNISNGFLPRFFGALKNPFAGWLIPSGSVFARNLDGVTMAIGLFAVLGLGFQAWRNRSSQKEHGIPVPPLSLAIVRWVLLSIAILAVTFVLSMNTPGATPILRGTPILLILLGILILVYSFVTSRTVFGRHVYAVGGNRNAALLSGVNTRLTDFMIFVNMGFLTAVAAIVTTSRAGNASAQAGTGYELDAIASCFIGGTAVTGGIGRVSGAMIGALIMGVLNMGLSIARVNANWQMAIKGLVLLIAVTLDLVSKRRSKVA